MCMRVCSQGGDGVEYLLIPVDDSTLTDFLEKEDEDVWCLCVLRASMATAPKGCRRGSCLRSDLSPSNPKAAGLIEMS